MADDQELRPNDVPSADAEAARGSLTPALIDDEDDNPRKTIDLDGDVSLEDLVRQATRPKAAPVSAAPSTVEPATGNVIDLGDASNAEYVTALKNQVEQERNNTLRALADLQNFRRRSDEERARIIRDANERLIKELLPVVDDFDRGLAAARENQSYEQLINGVESVFRKMNDTLVKQGVEPIPTVGQPFDPDIHEAVSVQEGGDAPDETVVQELRRGYLLHGRVIRPSLVIVAKS